MGKLALLFIITASTICYSQEDTAVKRIQSPPTGLITRDSLFLQFPEWQKNMVSYEPDTMLIDSLGKDHDIDVEIFFGTWCSDSRREVPRFFKILDESGFVQPQRVKLWAVDRSKKLKSGLTDKRNIEFVATFIFFQDDKEIGRIVEQPDMSLEGDILKIISRSR